MPELFVSNDTKTPENDTEEVASAEAAEAVATDATEATPEPEAVDAAAESDGAEAEAPTLEEQLAGAQAQADEFKDRYLRSEAELENVRKRSEREVQKARKFALEKFAGDLLAVMDSLDMGVQAAKAEGSTVAAVTEGSELTLKMFIDTLTKHGVEQIDPTGEKFDPEEHEAMVMQPSADAEPNTVLDTFQKGYKLNDRVLRAARVVVAKAAD
jgi:molecular chaperone GrpE